MSCESNQSTVSNITTLLSSIEYDRQAYRWFLMFISLPEVQQDLFAVNQAKEEYQVLKRTQVSKIIIYVVLALIVITSLLIKQHWLFLAGGIPLIVLVYLFQKDRKCVVAISEQFLLKNIQPDEFNWQTLYQICENLAKKYNTLSLVDMITGQDFIVRKLLLGVVLFIPFIYPFKSWQILVVIFIVYSASLAILNTSIILRKLK